MINRRQLCAGFLSVLYQDEVTVLGRMQAQRLSLSDFGLGPNNDDPTIPLRSAIKAIAGGSNAEIIVPSGVWTFRSHGAEANVILKSVDNLTIRGEKSCRLVSEAKSTAFTASQCRNLTIDGISFSQKSLPFSQCFVHAIDDGKKTLVLDADDGFVFSDVKDVIAITEMNASIPCPMLLGIDVSSIVDTIEILNPGRIMLKLNRPVELGKGAALILKHSVGPHLLRFSDCTAIFVHNSFVHSSPGMAFVFENCHGIRISKVSVIPEPGSRNWMSSNADAIHCASCSGEINILDSVFRLTGDDAINIHSEFFFTSKKDGTDTAQMTLRSIDSIAVEDQISAIRNQGKEVHTLGRVQAVSRDTNAHQATIVVDGIEDGDIIFDDEKQSKVHIKKCFFSSGRARGALIHSNATISQCTFTYYGREAILAFSNIEKTDDSGAKLRGPVEGPLVDDIEIDQCHFEHCCLQQRGSAFVAVWLKSSSQIESENSACNTLLKSVSLSNSLFKGEDTRPISVSNVRGLHLKNVLFRGRRMQLSIDCCTNVIIEALNDWSFKSSSDCTINREFNG